MAGVNNGINLVYNNSALMTQNHMQLDIFVSSDSDSDYES